jgi:uncharacterized protein (TIGR03435 family)
MSELASSLAGVLRAPVADRTGLTERYSFTLKYAPSVFEALPDQLGLRLEKEKASVETLVIDNVQRPSEN